MCSLFRRPPGATPTRRPAYDGLLVEPLLNEARPLHGWSWLNAFPVVAAPGPAPQAVQASALGRWHTGPAVAFALATCDLIRAQTSGSAPPSVRRAAPGAGSLGRPAPRRLPAAVPATPRPLSAPPGAARLNGGLRRAPAVQQTEDGHGAVDARRRVMTSCRASLVIISSLMGRSSLVWTTRDLGAEQWPPAPMQMLCFQNPCDSPPAPSLHVWGAGGNHLT